VAQVELRPPCEERGHDDQDGGDALVLVAPHEVLAHERRQEVREPQPGTHGE
jgi:hypothetical protein